MKRVFVDSGGFCALLLAEDAFHIRATEIVSRAHRENWKLVTTNAVVMETFSLLIVRARDPRARLSFLDMVLSDAYQVERVRTVDEQRALKVVRAQMDKSYSLCDALSFAVMERLGIREAIAFDRHFREYGRFVVL